MANRTNEVSIRVETSFLKEYLKKMKFPYAESLVCPYTDGFYLVLKYLAQAGKCYSTANHILIEGINIEQT